MLARQRWPVASKLVSEAMVKVDLRKTAIPRLFRPLGEIRNIVLDYLQYII